MVDLMFPSFDGDDPDFKSQEYSSFGYWRESLIEIDAEEIKRVAWQYLNDKDVTVTALGPLHGMPTYVDLRRSTTVHRY